MQTNMQTNKQPAMPSSKQLIAIATIAADSNSNNNMLIAIAIIIMNTKLLLTDCKMQIRIFVPTLARIALLYLPTSNIALEARPHLK